jgi:hypothetical protein
MKAHEILKSPEAWCQESPAEDRQGGGIGDSSASAMLPIGNTFFRVLLLVDAIDAAHLHRTRQ